MILNDALKQNRGVGPGFHMLRHLLSVVILAHHCRVAVFGVDFDETYAKGAALTPDAAAHLSWGHFLVELVRPGLFALVAMFFALSGFLVVGSALRNPSVKVFFANRALRILPALSIEVTLSALVLGPIVTIVPLAAYFTNSKFFTYFGNILGQITYQLPGVFLSNPWPDTVNANLWTLPAEFWCYFFMLALMVTGLVMKRAWITAGVVIALVIWLVLSAYDPDGFTIRSGSTHYGPPYIVMMFFFGVAFFINADRIVLHPALFIASGAGYYFLTLYDVLEPLSGVFLTYCMVYIGMMRFPRFDRLLKLDLSYGTYLYGFPITQAVIFGLLPLLSGMGPFTQFAIILPLVLALTLAFSTVSWTYIEKPALKLRKHVLREPKLLPAE